MLMQLTSGVGTVALIASNQVSPSLRAPRLNLSAVSEVIKVGRKGSSYQSLLMTETIVCMMMVTLICFANVGLSRSLKP